jgi:hypothetical protein
MCVSTDELVNPKAVANELAIINDPAMAKEQPVLVELVSQLHAASSATDLFALHTKLLARYLARQRLRGELGLDKSKVKSEIGELAAKTPKPIDDLRARQEELKRLKTAELASKWRLPRTSGRSPTASSGRRSAMTEPRLRSLAVERAWTA